MKKIKKIFMIASLLSLIVAGFSVSSSAANGFHTPPWNGKFYYIKSVASGNKDEGYFDLPGRNYRFKKGSKFQTWSKDTKVPHDQIFSFMYAGGDYCYIRSASRGFIDVSGSKNADGVPLIAWSRNNSQNQKFRLKHMGDGKWKIYTSWGRVLATKGGKTNNGTPIHTWRDHTADNSMWYIIDFRTKKKYEIASGVKGKLESYNYKSGKKIAVNPGKTKVEVWTMDRKNRRNPYRKVTEFYTAADGSFNLGKKYDSYKELFLISKSSDRSSAFTAIYPARGKNEIKDFVSNKYLDSNYVLVDTLHRGKQYYYKKGSLYYRANSTITRRYDFYFKDITKINYNKASVRKLMTAIGGRKAVKTDDDLDKTVRRVLKFISQHTKSSMGRDKKAKEAGDYMFRNCRKTPRSAVTRWPTLEEMADTFVKFGFIPMGNCTANSQVAAALMYAAGVPADRMFVSKYHYDMSWYVEHWVLAFKANNRWYSIDPQHARFITNHTMFKKGNLFDNSYFDKVRGSHDHIHPFEAWVLPGSPLQDVPYLGNPKDLDKLK